MSTKPQVSIILPTYNRAAFLASAIASIAAQTWRDWELIIVDDGSTDGTSELIDRCRATIPQRVISVRQENGGAYAARNRGLDLATGAYIAFYDSDDVWLPHHLDHCVAALDRHPELDWVYGACRIVDFASGRVLQPNAFYVDGVARPFLRLKTRADGDLRMLDDPDTTRCAIAYGLFCGLQNSVIRRSVFAEYRFEAASRNEAEDQIAMTRALSKGHRFAYFDAVHVVYHIHTANSSASASGASLDKRLALYRTLVRGFEDMRATISLEPREQATLQRRLAREHFWHIGYALLWQNGRREEALAAFRQGLRLWPANASFWKTFLVAWLRTRATLSRHH
jgi:glycosyltransferase involved in cell wall biosynthesis